LSSIHAALLVLYLARDDFAGCCPYPDRTLGLHCFGLAGLSLVAQSVAVVTFTGTNGTGAISPMVWSTSPFPPARVFALPFASPNPTFAQPVTDLAAGPDGTLWYVRGAAVGKIKLPSGLGASGQQRRF